MKKGIYYGIITIFFLIFSIKLCTIYSNSTYYKDKLVEKTQIYVNGSSAPRGRILDVNGKVLVDNIGIKTIYYNKIKGTTKEDELAIAKRLASILTVPEGDDVALKKYYLATHNNGEDLITDEEKQKLQERKLTSEDIENIIWNRINDIDYDEYTKKVAYIYALMNDGYNYNKKEILRDVLEEEYALVMESKIPGITGEMTWERKYLYGDTLKNILGRVGNIPKENKSDYLNNGYELTDIVGLSYLEYQYEDYLKGTKAKYIVGENNVLELVSEECRGNDLVLSIDIDIQINVERILAEKISLGQSYGNTEYYKDSFALISNPLSGEIIAIAGKRLNEDNTFSDISLNAISKSFTIGSAVKGATIAVGYKYDLITPGENIVDSCVKLYYVPQKCSFKRLGKVNDETALAYSSNYYQYMIAIKLTGNTYTPNMKINATKEHFDIYRNTLAEFGLGVKTEIDLPNEQIGIIGSKVEDDLLLNLAIGQYDTYTPIEVLQYINSVASGQRIALSLMKEIKSNQEVLKKQEINVLNNIDLEIDDLNRIREGMRLVLSEGTGKFYVPQNIPFAGKTGTSESFLDSDNDGVVDVATITSTFAGYYPADNPQYSLVVITPNVSHKEGNSSAFYYGASKITKDIVTFLNSYYE